MQTASRITNNAPIYNAPAKVMARANAIDGFNKRYSSVSHRHLNDWLGHAAAAAAAAAGSGCASCCSKACSCPCAPCSRASP